MSRVSTGELARYLLEGRLSRAGCLLSTQPHVCRVARLPPARPLQTSTSTPASSSAVPRISPRKLLKDQAKQERRQGTKKPRADAQSVPGWDLFIGLEIHAQLNTASKLFAPSTPPSLATSTPNSHVAPFDLAIPGSQPVFQQPVLIPALRAALALGCEVQPESRFDRKHYFWWDQPSGYQITQYYAPFAKGGAIYLGTKNGLVPEDGMVDADGNEAPLEVRIRQVQLEQDTAKTVAQPGGLSFIDFNRAGMPLIEIITDPFQCTPRAAAAVVRAIQSLLSSVDACVLGMEAGGLRADVNVSVRRTGDVTGNIGKRTEIKNLGTIKAIEDAIIAERDRHIAVLEAGGAIQMETRGWTLGGHETYRLRGKEGEVDYRYMPDPDIPPLRIGQDLVKYLGDTMPMLADVEASRLEEVYHLTARDATALMTLDGGHRVEYFYKVAGAFAVAAEEAGQWNRLVANWALHELGRLTAERAPKALDALFGAAEEETKHADLVFTPDGECARVPTRFMAELLSYLHQRRITASVAKALLIEAFEGTIPLEGLGTTIEERGLWFKGLTSEEYDKLVEDAMAGRDAVVAELVATGGEGKGRGKLSFILGRMMGLAPKGTADPMEAEKAIKRKIAQIKDSSGSR